MKSYSKYINITNAFVLAEFNCKDCRRVRFLYNNNVYNRIRQEVTDSDEYAICILTHSSPIFFLCGILLLERVEL